MIFNNDEPEWQMLSQTHKQTRENEGKGRCWKSWTSLRPERPGTKPKSTNKTTKRTDREKAGKQKQQAKQGKPIARRQTDRNAEHQKRRRTEGEYKGGRERPSRPRPEGGDDHERGARRARKSNSGQPKQNQKDYALRYVGRVVRVSRVCTRSQNIAENKTP